MWHEANYYKALPLFHGPMGHVPIAMSRLLQFPFVLKINLVGTSFFTQNSVREFPTVHFICIKKGYILYIKPLYKYMNNAIVVCRERLGTWIP
jgi:hypothetical protein